MWAYICSPCVCHSVRGKALLFAEGLPHVRLGAGVYVYALNLKTLGGDITPFSR